MKKIKSISTLFVALMLIVSMLGTSVFAATVYNGATSPELDGVVIEKNGYGGKATDDSYYAVTAVSTSFQTGFYPLSSGNTLELQFALADEASALVVYPRMYKESEKVAGNAVSYHHLEVDSAGMRYYGGDYSSTSKLLWNESIDIIPGRWYSLVAKFQDGSALEGQRDQEFYLNGELIHRGDGLTDFGYRNLAVGVKNAEHGVYLDNIIQSNNRGVSSKETHVIDVARSIPSEIVSVASGMVLNSETKTVTVNPYTTVADVKNAIVTTDGADDVVTVLKPNLVTVADADSYADGNVVVVASKNAQTTEQAYNYYNIEGAELDAEKGRGKNASDLHVASGTYNITSKGGTFGKAYHDESYKIEYVGSGEGISIANTLFDKATVGGSYGIFKCQFALEKGATLTIHYAMSPNAANYARVNLEEGKTSMGSKKEQPLSAPIENGKWHTLCIVGPTSSDKNGNLYVYIDGELVRNQEVDESYYGMRRPFIVPESGTMYLDNIEVRPTNVYDATEDIASWLDIDNAISAGNKIRYTAMPEASDFHSGANTNVRFCDEEWNEVKNTAEAKYVVAGEMDAQGYETRISYYTFAENASDYIAGGYYDKDNNFYVKAYGKNAGDSLYYATYETANKDELSEVVAGAMNTADNKAEISGTFSDKPYRFFFWDKDINPLVKSIALELKK